MLGKWGRWKKGVGERVERKKSIKKGNEQKKEGTVKRMRRGLKALWEIKQYQSNTDQSIQKLPIQRVVREVAQSIRADLQFQSTASMALEEAGEAFFMGLLEQANYCAIHT